VGDGVVPLQRDIAIGVRLERGDGPLGQRVQAAMRCLGAAVAQAIARRGGNGLFAARLLPDFTPVVDAAALRLESPSMQHAGKGEFILGRKPFDNQS
jgi:hypothetical protein